MSSHSLSFLLLCILCLRFCGLLLAGLVSNCAAEFILLFNTAHAAVMR